MDYLMFFGGLVALIVGGDRLVASALRLAHRAGVSALVAGVVIVGIGTSLPEWVTSIGADLLRVSMCRD